MSDDQSDNHRNYTRPICEPIGKLWGQSVEVILYVLACFQNTNTDSNNNGEELVEIFNAFMDVIGVCKERNNV